VRRSLAKVETKEKLAQRPERVKMATGYRKKKIQGIKEGKKNIDERRLWLSIRVAFSLFSHGP
jgi:hypothetical protein